MGKRNQYRTKQMSEILSYLKSVQGMHVTVNDIQSYFKEKEIPVGMTTIYRHLERMVQEGTVAKYMIDEKTSACYEYLGEEERCYHPTYYHCKCEKCGKLMHLECSELSDAKQHLLSDYGFQVNSFKTVIYGVCSECSIAL